MFVAITIHHPAPEHEEAFVEFMREVIEAVRCAAGLREADVCRAQGGDSFAGYTTWDDAAAFEAALPRILALAPKRRPEWTTAPDEAVRLVTI